MTAAGGSPKDLVFDVWGCRGTRNLDPGFSRIGVKTACYSLLAPPELLVFDAGKGLLMLAQALLHDERFAAVEQVRLLLSHSHMDHWEGLKDAAWFWRRSGRPLHVTLYGAQEALDVVRFAFAHPSFVPMSTLAELAGVTFSEEAISAGDERTFGATQVLAVHLNHYIGAGTGRRHLAALGFRVVCDDGGSVSYACDHEPEVGQRLGLPESLLGASLMVVDSYYGNEAEHNFGHGSIELAARLARELPASLVLAGHLGPQFTDETIIESVLRHAAGIQNCRIAREGDSYRWQASGGGFVSLPLERLAGRPVPEAVAVERSDDLEGMRALRHELKTPINQILGFTELLSEELSDAGITRHDGDLDKITRAAQDLLGQVESLHLPGSAAPGGLPSAGSAAVPPSAHSRPPGAEPPGSLPSAADGGERVLVVDDNEMNLDMLSRRLAARGYQVSTATDGCTALEQVRSSRFHAVLLDVMMPGISGLEVLQKLRKTYSVADLPVIMATARDNSEDIVEALRFGANDYVTKPLDFPVVLARLQTQISLKRAKERVDQLVGALEMRNAFIRSTFGRYLSDDVVATLLETPQGLRLGGERRSVTILMADLRGFTAMTRDMSPEQVMRVLNTYLGRMTEIINRHRGTIDEFIGDAILALFGAPTAAGDDAERAVLCALEMQNAMNDVNEQLSRDCLPLVEMGIGLNTGEVVAGNIGSEARTKYGIVGSHVNLTGRVESFAVGGQIMLTEATRVAAGPAVRTGKTVALNAKGFREPVVVHELVGLGAPHNISLTHPQDELVRLGTPIETTCWVLADKLIDTESFPAQVLALAGRGAHMAADARPAAMTNLRIRLLGDPEATASDIYAKVADIDDADPRCFFVRFTSLEPEMRARLAGWQSTRAARPGAR
jgi:adenylate cyclase